MRVIMTLRRMVSPSTNSKQAVRKKTPTVSKKLPPSFVPLLSDLVRSKHSGPEKGVTTKGVFLLEESLESLKSL